MKTAEYITPSGARVIIRDPQSPDFRVRIEKAVSSFMKKVTQHEAR